MTGIIFHDRLRCLPFIWMKQKSPIFTGVNIFTGLTVFLVLIVAIGLSLGATTGYAINPARDLGPRIAHFVLPIIGKGKSDWGYAWIPVAGPILGGMLGTLLYKALFKQEIYPLLWVIAPVVLIVIILAVIKEGKDATEK